MESHLQPTPPFFQKIGRGMPDLLQDQVHVCEQHEIPATRDFPVQASATPRLTYGEAQPSLENPAEELGATSRGLVRLQAHRQPAVQTCLTPKVKGGA